MQNVLIAVVREDFLSFADPKRAQVSMRFFKTQKGQYGEGDQFIGVRVPQTRTLVKKYYKDLTFATILEFLMSPVHEYRLFAVLVLVAKYQKTKDGEGRRKIYEFFIEHRQYVNNWDIVDSSAHQIVGAYLYKTEEELSTLTILAQSQSLWDRRIAMIASYYSIQKEETKLVLNLATQLLHDPQDLIHKAVGWMLREMGKSCGEKVLTNFLDKYAPHMPRTMLCYAIERLDPLKKAHYRGVVPAKF